MVLCRSGAVGLATEPARDCRVARRRQGVGEALGRVLCPVGPNRGPSSALQRRIFFHTYLSGAHTLHEEWGAEGNLANWDEGILSSYGRVTRDLLDFQDAHPDVGEPFTPIALVLDANEAPPDPTPWSKIKEGLFSLGEEDKRNAAREGAGKAEASCYAPCGLPELFDILPSDAPEALRSEYKAVIPVTKEATPDGSPWERLQKAAADLSPFARSTHLQMQINFRGSDGAWLVALYNPWGARRGDVTQVGSVLDEGCAVTDVIAPNFPIQSARPIHAWPASSALTVTDGKLHATVGPGGTLIIEINPQA